MLARAQERFVGSHGLVVSAGPFRGLEFPGDCAGEVHMLPAKLLGAYERELHEAVERFVAREPRRVINIGAGDGYYSIGLALRLPEAHIAAFDIDDRARRTTATVASANGCGDRVKVERAATIERLAELAGADTFVVSDCESCELELLDPERVPGLTQTAMLVELHDWIDQRITPALTERFSATHEQILIPMRPPDPNGFPELAALGDDVARRLLDEHRVADQQWLALTPIPR